MSMQSVEQLHFGFVPDRDLVVQRHDAQITSDAGLIPIAQADDRLGYTRRLADCLADGRRDPTHTFAEMLRQRLYGILADYEDCNDHDTLRNEPIFKLVAGRLPEDDPLASQPTLSRFENAIDIPTLYRLLDFLATTGVERLRHKHGGHLPDEVTLDIDATDDPTHGHQQLTFFHAYYDQYQYFPLIISEPTTNYRALAQRYDNPFLAGEGDCRVLMRNDPAEIRRMVDTMVETAKMSGGYMMCVGNHIPFNVPGEGVKTYFDLSAEYGYR